MKQIIKELFFRFASKPSLPKERAAILMYHSVGDRADYFSSVSRETFERQMDHLVQQGVPVVSLAELVRRLQAGESLGGAVALTFDDGYEDNYSIAFPILKQHNFPATIFVTTDLIGKPDKRNMLHGTAEQLREMCDSGLISIEPHTKTHPKLAKLSREQAKEEIADSCDLLERLLGGQPMLFAYPYGSYNQETPDLVRELGMRAAVTVEEGTVGPHCDLFLLPRNSIDRSTSFAQFRGKLSTTVDVYRSLKL